MIFCSRREFVRTAGLGAAALFAPRFATAAQTDRFELYNRKDDISETNNLAARMPDKMKELNAPIEQFLKDTQAVVPKPNPDFSQRGREV